MRKKLERLKQNQIELLEQAKQSECTEGCDGQCKICTEEFLAKNGVPLNVFHDTVKDLLIRGRGKYRKCCDYWQCELWQNVFYSICCLQYITDFCNPATGSFAWVGVHAVECIFLNDFR